MALWGTVWCHPVTLADSSLKGSGPRFLVVIRFWFQCVGFRHLRSTELIYTNCLLSCVWYACMCECVWMWVHMCMKRDVYNCVLVCWSQRSRLRVWLDHFHLIHWGRIFCVNQKLTNLTIMPDWLAPGLLILPPKSWDFSSPYALSIMWVLGIQTLDHPESALPAAEPSLYLWGVFFVCVSMCVCVYACMCMCV